MMMLAMMMKNPLLSQDTAMERATAAFKLLDVDSDGTLTEDEFVEGCMRDKTLANLLNSGNTNTTDRRLSTAVKSA